MCKFVFVTGGVVSGLGKGITAASLGRLLKQRGVKITAQKLDPYMNVDPGTMNPYEHGEVFVTDDGAETDLDLGHYERFIDESLTKYSSLTSGRVYWNVLSREREGGYQGGTVQVVPHVTQEIKNFVYAGAKKSGADVMIVEIGGTTGDIESQPFLEAIRQISLECGRENCVFIHVALVPYLKASNEHKTKPVQHSVKQLQGMGISPNIIITRSDEKIEQKDKDKIALFCNVSPHCVIENVTLSSLYEVPVALKESKFDDVVCDLLKLKCVEADLNEWKRVIKKAESRKKRITIALVGKYVKLHDAYLSIVESLNHAGIEHGVHVDIKWICAESVSGDSVEKLLKGVGGVLIPGGFGERGVEGKIEAARWARENNIPFLGICLGMQVAVIEFARNVCGIEKANSGEFCKKNSAVVDLMCGQEGKELSGGTMRLGEYRCKIEKNTKLHKLYNLTEIGERHRHRYEVNNDFREILMSKGLVLSGLSPCGELVEAVELKDKKFFVAVQYHPEFKSRPNRPHPLFLGLVEASLKDK
ncbi:MAG: CTP synthase [Firmicutes bacterium]|nr:CTP synthase [Bacillota bacterium]